MATISTLVEAVEIVPWKNRSSQNSGNLWIGPHNGAGQNLRMIKPTDQPFIITAPPGKKVDLFLIFIEVAMDGDGVLFTTIN